MHSVARPARNQAARISDRERGVLNYVALTLCYSSFNGADHFCRLLTIVILVMFGLSHHPEGCSLV